MPLARSISLVLLVPSLAAQVYDDLANAWKWEQGVRNECHAILDADPIDPTQVTAAIARLRGLLDYFADPRTQALAAGNDFRLQVNDITMDLAIAHAKLQRPAAAAGALDDLAARLDAGSAPVRSYVFQAERFRRNVDPAVCADPAVAAALRKLMAKDPYARLRATALATPYQPKLGEDERVAGLALFWSEAKYNFANFDLVPDLDWDAAFLRALPEVRAAADTLAYYRALQRLCAQLHDGHTNVNLPDPLHKQVASRPPLRPLLAEGRVFVGQVRSEQLRDLGVTPGQEIVRVDGEPVVAYAERMFGPYVSASTPQDRATRLLVYQLLAGAPDRPVTLGMVDADGASRDVVVPRTGHAEDPPAPDYAFTLLPNNVALVTLNTFDDAAVAKAFAADLDKLRGADALILDVRENGGGSSNIGYAILAHLTAKPFLGSRWQTADYRPAFRAWGRPSPPHRGAAETNQPAKGEPFDKPVAVLISPRTYSAAEDFAVAFHTMERGPLVGEATGGSTGQPLSIRLPGGGSARICTKRDAYADGREFVGRGVQPTVAVAPTVDDVRSGRDTVLLRALAELGKGPGGK